VIRPHHSCDAVGVSEILVCFVGFIYVLQQVVFCGVEWGNSLLFTEVCLNDNEVQFVARCLVALKRDSFMYVYSSVYHWTQNKRQSHR
jgi:hypothetical protein